MSPGGRANGSFAGGVTARIATPLPGMVRESVSIELGAARRQRFNRRIAVPTRDVRRVPTGKLTAPVRLTPLPSEHASERLPGGAQPPDGHPSPRSCPLAGHPSRQVVPPPAGTTAGSCRGRRTVRVAPTAVPTRANAPFSGTSDPRASPRVPIHPMRRATLPSAPRVKCHETVVRRHMKRALGQYRALFQVPDRVATA